MSRSSDTIEAAAEALRDGQLLLMPTETVYGLAADASNAQAVASIFEAKGRPRFNPLISHVEDAAAAETVAIFDTSARALADAFWPGPLTLVAPVRDRDRVCDLARAGLDSIAVRVPGHAKARAIIAAFGGAVVAPSANRSGRPSPTSFADAVEETGVSAAAAVDGGPCAVGVESTVVSVLDGRVALLRPGAVTRAEIEARLEALESPLRTAEAFGVEEIIDPRKTRELLCRFAHMAAPLRSPGWKIESLRFIACWNTGSCTGTAPRRTHLSIDRVHVTSSPSSPTASGPVMRMPAKPGYWTTTRGTGVMSAVASKPYSASSRVVSVGSASSR